MSIIDDHKDYLRHKHLGGVSNSKGNTYENFYATYQLSKLIGAGGDADHIRLTAQVERAFVDDLLIQFPKENFTAS